MKVAALYDIHGNLPALEAVLKEVEHLNVNQIVVGGDVVLGPMSKDCLDLLLKLRIQTHFIYGNCEVAVLNEMDQKPLAKLPESVLEDIRWTASQHTMEHRQIISRWPKTLQLTIGGLGSVLFCHGTPQNENENFTRLTPEDRLIPVFEKVEANYIVCGHTHMQFDRMIGSKRVINAGSVGMPFGNPGAYWLLLDEKVELRYTLYNLDSAMERILNTNYPHAEEFAHRNVVNPPTEETMLEVFRKAEMIN